MYIVVYFQKSGRLKPSTILYSGKSSNDSHILVRIYHNIYHQDIFAFFITIYLGLVFFCFKFMYKKFVKTKFFNQ